jgi:hypothetical protein
VSARASCPGSFVDLLVPSGEGVVEALRGDLREVMIDFGGGSPRCGRRPRRAAVYDLGDP